MANSDKNILITPSVGLSTNPTIKFNGANNTPTTLRVLDNGTVSFEGTSGQLFSIADSLSGSIFSVNDISGIPSIEVVDTGLVKINQYGGSTVFGASAAIQNSSSVNAKVSIQSPSATTPGLIVRGFASSSANIQEWHRSDGYLYAALNQYGNLYVSGNVQVSTLLAIGSSTRGTEKVFLLNDNAANVGLIVKGAASQTADLQQWQDSSGTVLAKVTQTGNGTFSYIAGTNGILQSLTGLLASTNITTRVNLTVQAIASQTANLQEWQNTSGTVLAYTRNDGMIAAQEVRTINNHVMLREENSGGYVNLVKATATNNNPGANQVKLYLRDGTNAGTLKLVVRAGTAGAETTILDNIPQS